MTMSTSWPAEIERARAVARRGQHERGQLERRGSGARRTGSGRRRAESSGSAEDPVHTYLKEIGRVPLLNAALEVEIAQAIEVGQRSRRPHWPRTSWPSAEKGRPTTC